MTGVDELRVTDPAEMLRRFERDWERLEGVLDARDGRPVHRGEGLDRDWSDRDVYAHLARWMARGREACERHLDGRPGLGPSDVDTLNAQWLAEDASLPLEEARDRAHQEHATWLALLRGLPPERWDDPVKVQVGGNGFGHFSEHIQYARDFLLATVDAWGPRYVELLDAVASGELHQPGSGWTGRDEYAHMARWLGQSREALGRHLRGEPPAEVEADEVLNARWQAEDRALTLEEARERYQSARARLMADVREIPAERWDDITTTVAQDDPMDHQHTHLRWITEGIAAQAEATWPRLVEALEAKPGAVLHHEGEPWTATEVYGHLGRWIDVSVEVAEAGDRGTDVVEQQPWEALNARWAAEDRALGLDAVRGRTEESRRRLLGLLRERPAERWSGIGLQWARMNLVGHVEEHLAFIEGVR